MFNATAKLIIGSDAGLFRSAGCPGFVAVSTACMPMVTTSSATVTATTSISTFVSAGMISLILISILPICCLFFITFAYLPPQTTFPPPPSIHIHTHTGVHDDTHDVPLVFLTTCHSSSSIPHIPHQHPHCLSADHHIIGNPPQKHNRQAKFNQGHFHHLLPITVTATVFTTTGIDMIMLIIRNIILVAIAAAVPVPIPIPVIFKIVGCLGNILVFSCFHQKWAYLWASAVCLFDFLFKPLFLVHLFTINLLASISKQQVSISKIFSSQFRLDQELISVSVIQLLLVSIYPSYASIPSQVQFIFIFPSNQQPTFISMLFQQLSTDIVFQYIFSMTRHIFEQIASFEELFKIFHFIHLLSSFLLVFLFLFFEISFSFNALYSSNLQFKCLGFLLYFSILKYLSTIQSSSCTYLLTIFHTSFQLETAISSIFLPFYRQMAQPKDDEEGLLSKLTDLFMRAESRQGLLLEASGFENLSGWKKIFMELILGCSFLVLRYLSDGLQLMDWPNVV